MYLSFSFLTIKFFRSSIFVNSPVVLAVYFLLPSSINPELISILLFLIISTISNKLIFDNANLLLFISI